MLEQMIEYFAEHTFLDLLSALIVIVAIVVGLEKFIKWLWGVFTKAYNKRKGREEEVSTIDKNTAAIEELSTRFEELHSLILEGYSQLDKKIDEQKEHLEEIDRDGKHRDMALMRDRLIQGLRYFSKNKDENGSVIISMTDYENLDELFNEYFKCGGNGVCHSLYENEFKKFKIDTARKY
jgi:hypothetical protein